MGAWGAAIFSDDLAADVRDEFRDLIGEGLSAEEATRRLEADYAQVLADPDEGPVFLFALAATQWRTGHVLASTIASALEALDAGRGMERWEDAPASDQRKRRRALDALAEQLRTPARDPLRIPRRRLQDTTLLLGDVVKVPRSGGDLLFAVIGFHVDKGGRAARLKLLPWTDRLPTELSRVRKAAGSATPSELHEIRPFFIVFNSGRTPERPPAEIEVVAQGLVDSPTERAGGIVTWWSGLVDAAEPALERVRRS